MSPRSHLCLRLAALALLASAAVWPRARGTAGAAGLARVTRSSSVAAHEDGARTARPETAAARLVSQPRTEKLVVASADE